MYFASVWPVRLGQLMAYAFYILPVPPSEKEGTLGLPLRPALSPPRRILTMPNDCSNGYR